jgi:hypothetical protein
MTDQETAFLSIRAALSTRVGADRAITLNDLAREAGLIEIDDTGETVVSRRLAERIIQVRLPDMGFVIVSDTRCGLFRPDNPDELNHYRNQLRSRIKELQRRIDTVDQLARNEGWTVEAGQYTKAPMQGQLPLISA